MSFAMAPENSFANMVIALQDKGVTCLPQKPVWGCDCTKQSYDALPNLSLNFEGMKPDQQKNLSMPKEAYMMYKK